MERKFLLFVQLLLLFFPLQINCVNSWDMTKSATEVSATKIYISSVTLNSETISTYKPKLKSHHLQELILLLNGMALITFVQKE